MFLFSAVVFFFALLQASFVFRWINCEIEIESHGKYYPSVIGWWFFFCCHASLFHSHARLSLYFFLCIFCSATLLTTFPFRIRFDTSTNVNERMIFVQHNDNDGTAFTWQHRIEQFKTENCRNERTNTHTRTHTHTQKWKEQNRIFMYLFLLLCGVR